MLPMQPPPPPEGTPPEVNGIDVNDWLEGVWNTLTGSPQQTLLCLLGAVVVAFFLQKAKVPTLVTVLGTLGGFWFSWNIYNQLSGNERPLFPGGFQADSLWEGVWQEGNTGALVFLVITVIVVLFTIWKTSMHLAWKILTALSCAIGVSFLYNFIDGWRTPV